VKTQIWIAASTYVLVAIVRKRLDLPLSLHSMLQILSVTPFENDDCRHPAVKREGPDNAVPLQRRRISERNCARAAPKRTERIG
jgi:hypothetical protein